MKTHLRSLSHHRRILVAPAAAGNWWDPNGESLDVWAAYQPKGAADLATSYTDLSGNSHDAGLGVAPDWDLTNGWKFNGSTHYLTTAFVPSTDQSQCAIVQFTNLTNTGALFGYVAGSSMSFGIRPNTGGDKVHYTNGLGCLVAPALSAGNLAVSGTQAYRNGVPEGDPIGIDPDNAGPIYIGARNQGIPYWFCAAYIQALALYGSVLTQAQVQAVQTAMAAL